MSENPPTPVSVQFEPWLEPWFDKIVNWPTMVNHGFNDHGWPLLEPWSTVVTTMVNRGSNHGQPWGQPWFQPWSTMVINESTMVNHLH